jgi:type I restriction enzyme S subunit
MSYPTVKMKDITLIKTGKLDSNAAVDDGAYPFFTCDPNTLKINNWAYDTEAVLLAGNNASGNYTAKYYKGKFNAYQRVYIIETADPLVLNIRYLCYALNQQLWLLKTMSSGSTTKFLTLGMLHGLDIPLPSIKVQEQIVSVLAAYDDLIENNQKQIKLLEEAAQRLYKEWFVDLRFPGHETTPITDGIPEGWRYRPLSEVFDFVRGKSYTSKELSDTEGVLMANLKNIRAFGGYKRNAEKRFTGQFKENQTLAAGDVVMGVTDMTQERRLVGHVALVPDMGEAMTFSMDLIKIIPKLTDKLFVYSALYYGGLSKQISPLANGVNVLHLKPEAMMGIEMLIPHDAIVRAYHERISPIIVRIEALQKQCDIAAEARDRLLPKLMNGEIEV